MESQLVVFDLAGEQYGVGIAAVESIIKKQPITVVPRAPDFVEGVTNLRGNVLPVIDLRKRFGLGVQEETKETRIVVVELKRDGSAGDVTVGALSTADVTGDYVQVSGTTHLAGGTLDPTGVVDVQGGVLSGDGNVAGNVQNAGHAAPGGSAGTLTIDGDYAQTAAGTLDVDGFLRERRPLMQQVSDKRHPGLAYGEVNNRIRYVIKELGAEFNAPVVAIVRDGRYTDVSADSPTLGIKHVDVRSLYDMENYRPKVWHVLGKPMFLY